MNDQMSSDPIAKAAPRGIEENVVFVVDYKAVGHYKNALADCLGSWKQTGKVWDASLSAYVTTEKCRDRTVKSAAVAYRVN